MSKASFDDTKDIILHLKKKGKITNKLRIYLEGYLLGLAEQNIITLDEANELRDIAETSKADPYGVGELFAFGNIEDYLDSKLEF